MAQPQHEFKVRLVLRDGSRCQYQGRYASGCDAVLQAMAWFDPTTVSALRVPPQPPAAVGGSDNSNSNSNSNSSHWLTQGVFA